MFHSILKPYPTMLKENAPWRERGRASVDVCYVPMCLHVFAHVRCVCVCVCVYVHVHVCMCVCMCEYMCVCTCVCMVLHTQTHVPLDIECVVIMTSIFSSVTVSSWYMYTVRYMHVFFRTLHVCFLPQALPFCQHTENFRRVEYLQDGPSPLGLIGGVATIGVLHLQQLSKGVQRCTKVSRYVQRCASV